LRVCHWQANVFGMSDAVEWTELDSRNLAELVEKVGSRKCVAEALRLETYTLTRYLPTANRDEAIRKPRGKLAIMALRERIKRERTRFGLGENSSSEKHAGLKKSTCR
jgi:hypothetical protein